MKVDSIQNLSNTERNKLYPSHKSSKAQIKEKQKICKELTTVSDFGEIDYQNINLIEKILNVNPKFKEDLRIKTYLNRGSSGVVYKGELVKNPNKSVALKLITHNKLQKEKRIKYSKKEVHIMNKVKNKYSINIYGMYDVGNKDSVLIVMEYAKYSDIENFLNLIQKKTINESVLAYLTRQILAGLLYCKNNNILHMDIKHQNILIDENITAKIADYSVSIEMSKENTTNDKIKLPLVGTSLFMSPEVLSSDTVDVEEAHKVDLYSLGTLLYILAYGKYPYNIDIKDKKNFPEILKSIKSNELEFNPSKKFSVLMEQFLKGLLSKDIKKRFSIEEALNHPWMKAAQILFSEKEKIGDLEKFLINLVTDNVLAFNEYISRNYN